MKIKILVADDDDRLRCLVCDILKKEGYSPIEARDGQEAMDLFLEEQDLDLIILDVMMPKLDGWEVLKAIREVSEIPVIMLTALGDELHEVTGLMKGADDYIGKPFSYEVFVARLSTLLRKIKRERTAEIVCGMLRLNPLTHRVQMKGIEVELNRKEYNLLMYMIRNKGIVLTREQILCGVWGYDFEGDIRTIDTHVKTLRAKLLEGGEYIKTIRGTGYLFEVVKDENH